MMQRKRYFSQYQSPNIVIVPTSSPTNQSPSKKIKNDGETVDKNEPIKSKNIISSLQKDQMQQKVQNINSSKLEGLNETHSLPSTRITCPTSIKQATRDSSKETLTKIEKRTNESITKNIACKIVKTDILRSNNDTARTHNSNNSNIVCLDGNNTLNKTYNTKHYESCTIGVPNKITPQTDTSFMIINNLQKELNKHSPCVKRINLNFENSLSEENTSAGNVTKSKNDMNINVVNNKNKYATTITYKSEEQNDYSKDRKSISKQKDNLKYLIPTITSSKTEQEYDEYTNENKTINHLVTHTISSKLNKNLNECIVKDVDHENTFTCADKNIFSKSIDKTKLTRQRHTNLQKMCTKIEKCNNNKIKIPKKIKIVINVTYNNTHTLQEQSNNESDSDSDSGTQVRESYNEDLSFLDDFNIDEIVESLTSCKSDKENEFDSDVMISDPKSKGNINNKLEQNNNSCVIKTTISIEKNMVDNSKQPKIFKVKKEELSKAAKPESSVDRTNTRSENGVNQNTKQNTTDSNFSQGDNHSSEFLDQSKTLKCKTDYRIIEYKDTKIGPATTSTTIQTKTDLNYNSCEKIVKDVKIDNNDKRENYCKIKNKHPYNKQECNIVVNKLFTKFDEIVAQKLECKMCDNFKENYSEITITHSGKFSKIFKFTKSNGQNYAVKFFNRQLDCYSKEKKCKKMLKQIQKDIASENLPCIYLITSFNVKNYWCYVTDYYPLNLQQVLQDPRKKFNIDQIRQLGIQLVAAVLLLRNNNIVHCDIKPSHILFDITITKLKLCGFDEAYYYSYFNNLSANAGTLNYRPPELILGYSNRFSIDVWSTALVMYEMATKSMLFPGTTNNNILFKQMSILGRLPDDMIQGSKFKNEHFNGTAFINITGSGARNEIRINNFTKRSTTITTSIFNAFSNDLEGIINASSKQVLFSRLIEKMLVLHPKNRLPIEYVYANAFFSTK